MFQWQTWPVSQLAWSGGNPLHLVLQGLLTLSKEHDYWEEIREELEQNRPGLESAIAILLKGPIQFGRKRLLQKQPGG